MSNEEIFGESAVKVDARMILWGAIATILACGGGAGLYMLLEMLMER